MSAVRDKTDLEFPLHLAQFSLMPLSRIHLFACIASILVGFVPSSVRSDPTDFFPSVPIHEDDSLNNEYELTALGCLLELTEYRPSRSAPRSISKTFIDLSDFDTNPNRVNPPYSNARLSTRHTLVWFAESVSEEDLEPVNDSLRTARLSLIELRNIDIGVASEKLERLQELFDGIVVGEFGDYAARNHTASYVIVGSDEVLYRVFVNRAFHLPVERNVAQQLIVEVSTYRSDHCAER